MSEGIVSGHAAGLDYDLYVPEGAGDGATVAVLLHGRGSHKGDLQALAPVLPTDWVIMTPQAPFSGREWGYGGGWAWYRYLGGSSVDDANMDESLRMLEVFLGALPETVGLTPGRVVLGGFSQGGSMSIAYALAHPGEVVAALNFSGFIADHLQLPQGDAAAAATPIFWAHGTRDPAVPFDRAIAGREALSAAGVPFVAVDYPIGHWIVPEAIHEAVAMVESIG